MAPSRGVIGCSANQAFTRLSDVWRGHKHATGATHRRPTGNGCSQSWICQRADDHVLHQETTVGLPSPSDAAGHQPPRASKTVAGPTACPSRLTNAAARSQKAGSLTACNNSSKRSLWCSATSFHKEAKSPKKMVQSGRSKMAQSAARRRSGASTAGPPRPSARNAA